MHLLIILNRNNPISAQEIEKYATAEIPDSVSHPRDRERVTTYMLHRPCGSINPEAPCCKKRNKCEHKFPKKYSDFDSFAELDGSPINRRRTPTFSDLRVTASGSDRYLRVPRTAAVVEGSQGWHRVAGRQWRLKQRTWRVA